MEQDERKAEISYHTKSRQRRQYRKRQLRMRFLGVLIAAVWIFVVVQAIAGALFEKNSSIATAFATTKAGEQQSILEITARCTESEPDVAEKKQMLYRVADKIGLIISEEPTVTETAARSEVSYQRQAAAADTELRVISLTKEGTEGMTVEHYVYAKIRLKHSVAEISSYKKLLQEVFEEMECEDISATIQLIGTYEGYLTLARRNEVTDEILKAMGGEIAYEHREDDLYTVYAYTALLDDYITVEGKKINLHIAMSKDEVNYRTVVYLASPILPDTW